MYASMFNPAINKSMKSFLKVHISRNYIFIVPPICNLHGSMVLLAAAILHSWSFFWRLKNVFFFNFLDNFN